MNIGRRIYFDTPGSVLLDTGERSGDVIETTKDQDFAAYPQLQGVDPAVTQFIQLDYGDRSAEFVNAGSLHVDPDTKNLTIYPRLELAADKYQVTADGADVATITASGVSDPTVVFSVDDVDQLPAVDVIAGTATFEFATNVPGLFMISAKSEKHGQTAVVITGV